jgi:hypothetical protein
MEALCTSPLAPARAATPEQELANLLALADHAFESGHQLMAMAFIESVYRSLDERHKADVQLKPWEVLGRHDLLQMLSA